MCKARETVILFYNTQWDQPLRAAGLALPDGCVITTDRNQIESATAVVFHLPEIDRIPVPRKRKGQIWVAWSMECDLHYPLAINPIFMALFDLKMTYRLDSDVPVPYYGHYLLERLRPAPRPKHSSPLAVLVISSPTNQSRRLELAKALMDHIEVHSFGRQLRNCTVPNDAGRLTKLDLIANYKFTLAFENAIAQDYVTEKFFDPLRAGSVPVYLGAPNIAEFTPGEHCFINAADFDSPENLAGFLRALAEDEASYSKYLDWKREPYRKEFLEKLEARTEDPFVTLCRKVVELREKQAYPAGGLSTDLRRLSDE